MAEKENVKGSGSVKNLTISLSPEEYEAFERECKERKMELNDFITAIMRTIIIEGLFNAILEDKN